jgi:hypothetical protein
LNGPRCPALVQTRLCYTFQAFIPRLTSIHFLPAAIAPLTQGGKRPRPVRHFSARTRALCKHRTIGEKNGMDLKTQTSCLSLIDYFLPLMRSTGRLLSDSAESGRCQPQRPGSTHNYVVQTESCTFWATISNFNLSSKMDV